MSAAAPPALPKLDNTFGALLIGVILAAALWGIGTAQCYWYYITYPKDRIGIKALVAAIWILDSVHQAVIVQSIYYFLIQNYFNPAALDNHIWSLVIQALLEGLVCLGVQGFFVYRIWKLSRKNYILVAIPSVFVIAKFAVTCAYTHRAFQIHSITEVLHEIHHLSISINGTAAAADIIIAATMTYLLYSQRTGWSNSNNMVNRLVVFTVNTGILTSMVALVTLIIAVSLPNSPMYAAFYFITGKLYFNTMLASLNARNSIVTAKKSSTFELSTNGAAHTTHTIPRYERKVERIVTYDVDPNDSGTLKPQSLSDRPKYGETV
uniref:DUF6534 domain-containing protein n=1 Tax=Psilocybe cubensis TaxID=181762 RepID=A0A8H7XRP8_PSICU